MITGRQLSKSAMLSRRHSMNQSWIRAYVHESMLSLCWEISPFLGLEADNNSNLVACLNRLRPKLFLPRFVPCHSQPCSSIISGNARTVRVVFIHQLRTFNEPYRCIECQKRVQKQPLVPPYLAIGSSSSGQAHLYANAGCSVSCTKIFVFP
jgi:hypothetical protein